MSSLHAAWILLTLAIRSNPSFINQGARAQEQVIENESEGKDVESGQHTEEIEEVPRDISDAGYVIVSLPDGRELM